MRGYWHFVAMAIVFYVLTLQFKNYWIIGAFLLWLAYLYYSKRLHHTSLVIIFLFLLFFIYHMPPVNTAIHLQESSYSSTSHLFHGQIISPIQTEETNIKFLFHDHATDQTLQIIFFPESPLHQNDTPFKYGATCEIQGHVKHPRESRNPGQFDYQQYLLHQGVTYEVILEQLSDITCEGHSVLKHVYSFRTILIDHVMDHISIETAAWLNALVLGDDSNIEDDVIELFQRWSLSHILAISGLHVGLIVGLLYFILVKLGIVTKEKAQWILMFFLPFYAFIAGGAPSVWRASLMAFLFIILNKLKLKLNVIDILSIVFLLLIIVDQYIIYQVGFQLSFIVTFGLILSRQWIFQQASPFWRILKISFVAQMMILPLQFAYFFSFQPLSILLNVIVVPYFSLFVIPFMFLLLIFSFLPTGVMSFFDMAFSNIHHIFMSFLYFIDDVANYPWIIGGLPFLVSIVYYLFFYLLMKNVQFKKVRKAFQYGCLIILLITTIAIRPYLSSEGTVTMLDIGQGDAFVIELPYRKAVIFMDAGARFSFDNFEPNKSVYSQVIKPYLYSRGISHVDAIFLSHEHIDHYGSVPFIAEDMQAETVVMSHYYELAAETKLFWEDQGIKNFIRVNLDDVITVGGQKFDVLAPSKFASANENSLVLHTKIGHLKWLFTGDIYKNTERDLVNRYPDLDVDVLKVAHHGSKTSTDQAFLKAINPTYALIPVGVNNRYNHPSQEVIDVLDKEGIIILRTDRHGAVQFIFNKKQGTFFKYLP